MDGKKIIGNASKATLPNGKKMEEFKKQPSFNSNKINNMTNKSSLQNSEQENKASEEEKPKSKAEQVAGDVASEALKKSLKAAFPYIPQFIINKLVDSNLGQAVIEKQLKGMKIKIILGLIGVVATVLMWLFLMSAMVALIMAPVAFIGDALNGISSFFKSLGNWFIGNGWCATEGACQQLNEQEYYEKLTKAVNNYKGSCSINEDLITATIFYGQMVSEKKQETNDSDNTEEVDENLNEVSSYFDYIRIKEDRNGNLTGPTAASKIDTLINVYWRGEEISSDEELTTPDKCINSAVAYRDYLIDTYIDSYYPSAITSSRTKEDIADEILQMGGIINNGGLTIIEDTDGLFTMLPSNLHLSITSNPANCRCHPTKKIFQSHKGVDIGGAPYGTQVLAFEDGIVDSIVIATQLSCGSSIIKIKHTTDTGDVYYTRYVHLNRSSNTLLSTLKPGDSILKGQVIGYVGGITTEDSCSTGPHLHFEVYNSQNQVINPVVALNNYANGIDVLANQELIEACSINGGKC